MSSKQILDRILAIKKPQDNQIKILIPNGSQANIDPVAKAFETQTGIAITLVVASVDDINNRMVVEHLANRTNYDLALPATFGLPDLVSKGIIRSFSPFQQGVSEPTSLYDLGDTFEGERYGYQTDGDAYLMFYRKDWLSDPDIQNRYADRFGVPLAVPATWAELDRQMSFFHAPDENRYGGALFRTPGYLAWEYWARLHAKGVWPFADDMTPVIDTATGVQALDEMKRASEHLYPYAQSAGLFDNWRLFSEGDVYCNIGWGGSQKYFNRALSPVKGKLTYAQLPGGVVDQVPYFNWGWSYVVPSVSRVPELAYLYACYATLPEQSTLAVRQRDGYFDPFTEEHYQDAVIRQTYSPDFLDVHRKALQGAMPDLYLPGRGEYMSSLTRWLSSALNNEVPSATALSRAAGEWQLITRDIGTDQQIKRWQRLKSLYPEAIAIKLTNG
ncbi:extracellular solute-binding protein [Pseudaestuariivita rosea]|uniref:extracellular solute-binding protein n=1 Tax=Pseudaestuariivita rosea TaxID=2763263 RepID=UPI001ABBCB8F|nr:extracellular solute-binding protein [Pseudaestuariivita rosea]